MHLRHLITVSPCSTVGLRGFVASWMQPSAGEPAERNIVGIRRRWMADPGLDDLVAEVDHGEFARPVGHLRRTRSRRPWSSRSAPMVIQTLALALPCSPVPRPPRKLWSARRCRSIGSESGRTMASLILCRNAHAVVQEPNPSACCRPAPSPRGGCRALPSVDERCLSAFTACDRGVHFHREAALADLRQSAPAKVKASATSSRQVYGAP